MADISQDGWMDEPPVVPYGFCECGCGEKTVVSRKSEPSKGWVRGEPRRFALGHSGRKALSERYDVDENGCWVWNGARDRDGYGKILSRSAPKKTARAHRFFYIRYVGPIPDGLQIDHLCRNRACVNPAHLEPVTGAVNSRRGSNAKLSEEDAIEIRKYLEIGWAQTAVAVGFGVNQSVVSAIHREAAWVLS